MKKVILSTPLLLEEGIFKMSKISLEEARNFAKEAKNYVGHSTVKILGIEPSSLRETCTSYDEAIILKINGRLDFGKEYSLEEIEEIGYTIFKISEISEKIEEFISSVESGEYFRQ